MILVALRKAVSFSVKVWRGISAPPRNMFIKLANSGVEINSTVFVSSSARIRSTDGAALVFGRDVFVGEGCEITARGGNVSIGDNVHIGRGCVISSMEVVFIGDDTQIAEYVVIRDQDHSTDTSPIRKAGFVTGKIYIGRDCWLGAKSTVLRDSTIGDGAVIGAHSLVRGTVPPRSVAVGCPAKVVHGRDCR